MSQKKALVTASVASMIDLFNMDNIHILQEAGYEVHVASNFAFGSITSPERVEAFRKELLDAGISVHHMPIPRSIKAIKYILESYRQMKRLMETEEYHIVHTQSPIGGVITRLAAGKSREKGTRVIYTAHGFHFFCGASKLNWLFFYPIEKFFSGYTDVLITINKEDYDRANTFHAGEVCYVPGIGVDVERLQTPVGNRADLRREFGFAEEDFVFLSVGQLSKRKNQETIIRAMERFSDEHIKYLVVGLGEKEEEDRNLIAGYKLEDRVVLAGYREDIEALMQMADAFVFPSLQEGLPVALMEAMAVGLPVIASKIRGNTDLITDGVEGKLVEAMDINGYAEAMEEIIRQPQRAQEYGKNAQKKIQQFSIGCVHEKMKEIYEKFEY